MHFQWVVEAGSPNVSNNIVLLTFLVCQRWLNSYIQHKNPSKSYKHIKRLPSGMKVCLSMYSLVVSVMYSPCLSPHKNPSKSLNHI